MLVQILHAGRTDAVFPEQALAGAHSSRRVRERLGHDDHDPAARGHTGRRAELKQGRTNVDPFLGHGQRPRQQRLGGLPQLQELHPDAKRAPLSPAPSSTASFDVVVMNRARRRQSSAEWAARCTMDFCDKNWRTGCRPLRAHSDAHFKEAVEEAAALHARDELFAKHITPESAGEGSLVWAVAEESDDDEDGTPPHADADEHQLIAMLPAPASALPMSNLERCIALCLENCSGPR